MAMAYIIPDFKDLLEVCVYVNMNLHPPTHKIIVTLLSRT